MGGEVTQVMKDHNLSYFVLGQNVVKTRGNFQTTYHSVRNTISKQLTLIWGREILCIIMVRKDSVGLKRGDTTSNSYIWFKFCTMTVVKFYLLPSVWSNPYVQSALDRRPSLPNASGGQRLWICSRRPEQEARISH